MKKFFVLLCIIVCGNSFATAAPSENVDESISSQPEECDDPCLLCGLYIDYILEDAQSPSMDQRYLQSTSQRYDQSTGQRYDQSQAMGQRYAAKLTGQRYAQVTDQRYAQGTGQRYNQAAGQRYAGAQYASERVQQQQSLSRSDRLMDIISLVRSSRYGRKKRQDSGEQCLSICNLCFSYQQGKAKHKKTSTLKETLINSVLKSMATVE